MRTTSLDELNDVAELQTRVDRKYILSASVLDELIDSMSLSSSVLEIDGRRSFGYESIYFDTPHLDLYRAAALGRRRRYKVRTRAYQDSGLCMLEVKTKGGRGQTVKSRLDYDPSRRKHLTHAGREFVAGVVGERDAGDDLEPVLTTRYRRTTFVDVSTSTRMTYDRDLRCVDWDGRAASIGDAIIVETKSAGRPSANDRWLWSHGIRPVKISKFATSLAALHPHLPNNKWHRTLEEHVHAEPLKSG